MRRTSGGWDASPGVETPGVIAGVWRTSLKFRAFLFVDVAGIVRFARIGPMAARRGGVFLTPSL